MQINKFTLICNLLAVILKTIPWDCLYFLYLRKVLVSMQEILKLLEELPERRKVFFTELLTFCYHYGKTSDTEDFENLLILVKSLVRREIEVFLEEDVVRAKYN